MTDKSKNDWACVKSVEDVKVGESVAVMGTVRLTKGAIVYVPTPTADPQGNDSSKNPKGTIALTRLLRSLEHAHVAENVVITMISLCMLFAYPLFFRELRLLTPMPPGIQSQPWVFPSSLVSVAFSASTGQSMRQKATAMLT